MGDSSELVIGGQGDATAARALEFQPVTVTGQAAPLIPRSAWPWIIAAGVLVGAWYFIERARVRSNPDDVAEAEQDFEGFHWGRKARRRSAVKVSPRPRALVKLGRLDAITYGTKKGSEPFALYEHQFGEEGGKRPILAMDPKSRRLHIVGGDYTVEDRGIVD